MRDIYGSRFVGIGLHQYNSNDPMYISDYENLPFQGAPQCIVNRGTLTDPYYGTDNEDICHDMDNEIAKGANVSVAVEGDYNEAKTAVNATVKINSFANLSGLRLSLVLIADSLLHNCLRTWHSLAQVARGDSRLSSGHSTMWLCRVIRKMGSTMQR